VWPPLWRRGRWASDATGDERQYRGHHAGKIRTRWRSRILVGGYSVRMTVKAPAAADAACSSDNSSSRQVLWSLRAVVGGYMGVLSSTDLADETALILAAQADPSCFGELYRRHVTAVHALAWARLGDRASAEDVTAETFRRALWALPRYEPRGVPLIAWLMKIALNLVRDEIERRQRAQRFLNTAAAAPAMDGPGDDVELRIVVHELVHQLGPDQRQVIELRFGADLPIADVAARLGRSPDAVKQLQRRAVHELRRLLIEEA
jgi:RNA polymerase sigma-70 factor, ECF subfamily